MKSFLARFCSKPTKNLFTLDVFSQISDTSGVMDYHKFGDYLREVLALPTAVFEGPTFGFSDAAVKQCFDSVRIKF